MTQDKRKWIKEEITYLKDNVNHLSTNEISEYLQRSKKAVRLKSLKLGLRIEKMVHENGVCLQCNVAIPHDRCFCSHSCAAKYNNVQRKRKYNKICCECGAPFSGYKETSKYCNRKCMGVGLSRQSYEKYISNTDAYCDENYSPKSFKYIFLEEQGGICAIEGCGCGTEWNGKKLIFVLDHIDGNASNNARCNLRLVCPNCDSQLPTFKSKNRGNGRHFRVQRRLAGKSH